MIAETVSLPAAMLLGRMSLHHLRDRASIHLSMW